MAYLAISPAWKAVPHATMTTLSASRSAAAEIGLQVVGAKVLVSLRHWVTS
jgi:hypothetical protein